MKSDAKKLIDEALRLPPEARAALAGQLIESLDVQVDEDAEEAWSLEIARRLKDIEAGKVRGIPWTRARRQILGLVGESEDT